MLLLRSVSARRRSSTWASRPLTGRLETPSSLRTRFPETPDFAVTRFIASFLFGVKPYDPMAFVAVPVILSVVALFAVWLPATRASKLDPMESLRVE